MSPRPATPIAAPIKTLSSWYYPTSYNYPYANHTLAVDLKASNFGVIFTDFKNASNDVVIEATTVQTSYPDGRVVVTEANYTQIIYND